MTPSCCVQVKEWLVRHDDPKVADVYTQTEVSQFHLYHPLYSIKLAIYPPSFLLNLHVISLQWRQPAANIRGVQRPSSKPTFKVCLHSGLRSPVMKKIIRKRSNWWSVDVGRRRFRVDCSVRSMGVHSLYRALSWRRSLDPIKLS